MAAKAKVCDKKTKRTPLPAAVVGLLNRNQVTEALGGISVRTLNAMISRGEFPRHDVRVGRFPRWSVESVNDWCRSRRDNGDAETPEG